MTHDKQPVKEWTECGGWWFGERGRLGEGKQGAGEVGGQGFRADGAGGKGKRAAGGRETPAKRKPATSMFKFEPERRGGRGGVEGLWRLQHRRRRAVIANMLPRPGPLSAVSPLAWLYMLPYGCIAHIHGHTHTHIYTHTAIYMHGLGEAPVSL